MSKIRTFHAKYLLIHILAFSSYSQNLQYASHYNLQSGMLSNTTYYGMFDRRDFLWICQNHGLSRFDGVHFTNFTLEDGLPDNDIVHVTEDTKGTIWAEPFQREPAFLKKNAFRFQNVKTILHPDTVKRDQSYRVFALKDGKVGLVTEHGVIRIIGGDRLISSYYTRALMRYHSIFLYETDDKKLILYSSSNQFTIDLSRKTIKKESFIRYSRVESNNEWVCFQDVINGPQLYCIHLRSGKKIRIDHLSGVHRFGIFKNGILINREGTNLSFFDFNTQQTSAVQSKVILAHAAENKAGNVRVLFSANDGIHVLNRKSAVETPFGKAPGFFYLREKRVYVSDALGNILNAVNTEKNIFPLNSMNNLFAEHINGKDLTYGSAVIVSNPDELPHDAAKMMGVKAVSILNDSIRYIATQSGAFRFNNRTRKAKLLYLGRSTAISPGPGGSVFIGTIRGLMELTAAGKLIDWSETGKFKQIRITDLCFRNNVLWIATAGDGLSALCKGKVHRVLSSRNGTSGNHIETIEGSEANQLYIGYPDGAQMLSYTFSGKGPIIRKLVTLDIFNGEGIRDFFFHAGIIYGLSNNSLYRFDTRKKIPVRFFKLQLTKVLINGATYSIQHSQKLKPGKYHFRIEFSTQNYQRLPVRYRYRVNREKWNYLSDGNITLDQLGPGDYELSIQVLNNYNRPSDTQVLAISIAYPFYVRGWFLGLSALFLLAAAYVLIRHFTRQHYKKLNNRLIQENKLRELELTALKAQINPHFVFNCLNSIKSLIYQERMQDADLYIDRFARLLRNTLEASFQQDHPLSAEINYLKAYLEIEQMSMNYKFNFEFIVDPFIQPDQVLIPAMLLQPHVENAIKHGMAPLKTKNGLITVSFLVQEHSLVCIIRDNGQGKEITSQAREMHLHTGKGLFITEKRARLHQITTESLKNESGGVTVILKLKMTKHHD